MLAKFIVFTFPIFGLIGVVSLAMDIYQRNWMALAEDAMWVGWMTLFVARKALELWPR